MSINHKNTLPTKERIVLYYTHETKTTCLFYKNYSDWLLHAKEEESTKQLGWGPVDGDSEQSGFRGEVTKELNYNEFTPVSSHYLKKIRYIINSETVYKQGDSIHIKFTNKVRVKTGDKKFFKTVITIRHIIFSTKTNNFTHIRKKFNSRKWISIIRVNDFSITKRIKDYFPNGTNSSGHFNSDLIKTLLISLNFDINTFDAKISMNTFNKTNFYNLLIEWYIKRNHINYDIPPGINLNSIANKPQNKDSKRNPNQNNIEQSHLNKFEYLTYNRPPKRILNKFDTYSEALIHHFKINNCNIITNLYDGEYYDLSYIGLLNNFLPYDKFKFFDVKLFSQKNLPKLRRKYKVKISDFNDFEQNVIINRIKAYPHWLNSLMLELEELVELRSKSKYKTTFTCYEEICSSIYFLIGQKETKKLRKSLKKHNISL